MTDKPSCPAREVCGSVQQTGVFEKGFIEGSCRVMLIGCRVTMASLPSWMIGLCKNRRWDLDVMAKGLNGARTDLTQVSAVACGFEGLRLQGVELVKVAAGPCVDQVTKYPDRQ